MTVIAFDGLTVAADRLDGAGSMRYRRPSTKLVYSEKLDVLFGLTGEAAFFAPLINWYENGKNSDDFPFNDSGRNNDPAVFLVFRRSLVDGQHEEYRFFRRCPQIIDEPDAWGSGAEYAIGAMDAGLCARDAVIIAAGRDKNSGNGVLTFDLRTMSWIAENGQQVIAKTARLDRDRNPET